jgi:hypothetical protein
MASRSCRPKRASENTDSQTLNRRNTLLAISVGAAPIRDLGRPRGRNHDPHIVAATGLPIIVRPNLRSVRAARRVVQIRAKKLPARLQFTSHGRIRQRNRTVLLRTRRDDEGTRTHGIQERLSRRRLAPVVADDHYLGGQFAHATGEQRPFD